MDNKTIIRKYDKPVSYRLPEKTKLLIEILAKKLQISKTAIVTLAVLRFAEQENVTDEKEKG